MDLSVVTTLFESAPFVADFHRRASAAASSVTDDYEIVFVNDGSPGDSLEIALALADRDPRVRVVDLARNFGHHRALMIGLGYARGRRVFLLDSDLEEEPEVLALLWAEMNGSGADVVFGVQGVRQGSFFERLSGALFWRLFNLLSSPRVVPNQLTLRLMTRRYVDALVRHEEREVAIEGLWTITGFAQRPLVVNKVKRTGTTYTLGRRVGLMVNAVTSFSSQPLLLVFYLGFAISMISAAAALYLLVRKFIYGGFLQGWTWFMVSIWLLGGVTILCIGVIGIYLSKIFSEVKRRPYSIVRQVYERGAESADESALTISVKSKSS